MLIQNVYFIPDRHKGAEFICNERTRSQTRSTSDSSFGLSKQLSLLHLRCVPFETGKQNFIKFKVHWRQPCVKFPDKISGRF